MPTSVAAPVKWGEADEQVSIRMADATAGLLQATCDLRLTNLRIRPYVNNSVFQDDDITAVEEIHYCRLYQNKQAKTQGQGERKTPIRLVRPCPTKLKKTPFYHLTHGSTPSGYTIEKFGGAVEHNHNIDNADAIKRNHYIKNVVLAQK